MKAGGYVVFAWIQAHARQRIAIHTTCFTYKAIGAYLQRSGPRCCRSPDASKALEDTSW